MLQFKIGDVVMVVQCHPRVSQCLHACGIIFSVASAFERAYIDFGTVDGARKVWVGTEKEIEIIGHDSEYTFHD